MSPHQLFTLSVTLPERDVDLAEVRAVVRSCLPRNGLATAMDPQHRPVLIVTVAATDIWLAALVVMNAVTSTGYEPVRLTADQATEAEAEVYASDGPGFT